MSASIIVILSWGKLKHFCLCLLLMKMDRQWENIERQGGTKERRHEGRDDGQKKTNKLVAGMRGFKQEICHSSIDNILWVTQHSKKKWWRKKRDTGMMFASMTTICSLWYWRQLLKSPCECQRPALLDFKGLSRCCTSTVLNYTISHGTKWAASLQILI